MIEHRYDWIPIEKDLPTYGESVLTQLIDGDMCVNWLIDDEEPEWFYDDVVAWMPLPEKYIREHVCCYWYNRCKLGHDECSDSYKCEDFD